MVSFTEENYLKIIYKLCASGDNGATTNAIAQLTQTKPSSVSDMLKKMSDRQLVDYKKYQGVSLTEEGERLALRVIRRHRLWEVFLVEKLSFAWDEVHELAEELEHIESEQLIIRLDEFLGFPQFDPHGDPIPDQHGKITKVKKIKLTHIEEGLQYKIVGMEDTSDAFLQYLTKIGLDLSSKVTLVEKIEFDQSMVLNINGKSTTVSHKFTENVWVSEL
ncbi:metal-dependent transcriptional regulator [Cytophagaceae bacterium DM2B3-1]|uniref:Transcriptional regulator MntR n=1 Tax=Xanthocytophaga flava TaxID=3048013 RepID=A0ABT7CP31_9BACT|nr:metal-dependent transcriptional regulator [Xanthocytophaga flavus]MDJ1495276.1 metal-dependent transcriptional regulator [Xanthocytophaga flavus]